MVPTPIKRAKLRSLYTGLEASGKKLSEALTEASNIAVDAVLSGKAIVESSGNGFSVSYELLKGFNPTDAVELVDELITRYDAAIVALGTGSTDADIYSEMLAMLEPVTEVYSDFSQVSRV